MAAYSINDFQIGECVCHISNTQLRMAVIGIDKDKNEISCRWVDNEGKPYRREFMSEELGKCSDLGPKMGGISKPFILP